ncbi:uncharacterized protein PAC_19047 [Phialocephala subalpina]|uniref:Tyrosinase copper-binding domain-containing protein n=1 Tax=Phialocephala subalpina TaxID=576137 RepID=A0A1L7XVV4_9HELO|nr:uncharacterized protein PAC_19047 [Phialocephala subalpina]
MSQQLQLEYLDAVLCMMDLPSITPFSGPKTRFDDFQALHIALTYGIHWVGQFLHFHRGFLHFYEKTLREECGYSGAQPYWSWSLDYSFTNSPIFDPVYGFGGNGAYIANWTGFFGNSTPTNSGGGCIQDGPFVNYNLSVGPGTSVTSHCIVRNFNSNFAYLGNSTQVANTTKQPNFEAFRQESGGAFKPPPFKIHDSGHGMISGEMGNVFSSPGDPLFYLHHANLDRVWAIWQDMDLEARLTDISGYTSVWEPFINVTLDYQLNYSTLGPLTPIRDVMYTRGTTLCYEYI